MDPRLHDLLGTPTPVEPPAGLAARTAAFVRRQCARLRPRQRRPKNWPGRPGVAGKSVWPRADVAVTAALLIGVLGVLLPTIAAARQAEHTARHAESFRAAMIDPREEPLPAEPTMIPLIGQTREEIPAVSVFTLTPFRPATGAPKPLFSPDCSRAWPDRPLGIGLPPEF